MIRKAKIAAIVALGLMVGAAVHSPAYGRFVSSARSFQRHFHDLKTSGSSLSPVERIVFSLALANTKTVCLSHRK